VEVNKKINWINRKSNWKLTENQPEGFFYLWIGVHMNWSNDLGFKINNRKKYVNENEDVEKDDVSNVTKILMDIQY
jgi:hypothetical protein